MKTDRRPASRPAMRINRAVAPTVTVIRPTFLLPTPAADDHRAVKAAEKLMLSCRENVAFLNRQLAPYASFLELPPMTDNVLYLAYTIVVRETAPFTARELRRWLADAGIETRAQFSFSSAAEPADDDRTAAQMQDIISFESAAADSFCLACHQSLTILDLRRIVDTIAAFVSRFVPADAASPAMPTRPEGA